MILLMRSLIFSAFLFLIFSKRPFKKKIFKFSCVENCCFSAFSPENFSSEAENVFLSCPVIKDIIVPFYRETHWPHRQARTVGSGVSSTMR